MSVLPTQIQGWQNLKAQAETAYGWFKYDKTRNHMWQWQLLATHRKSSAKKHYFCFYSLNSPDMHGLIQWKHESILPHPYRKPGHRYLNYGYIKCCIFTFYYTKDQECYKWITIREEKSNSSIYKIECDWVDWLRKWQSRHNYWDCLSSPLSGSRRKKNQLALKCQWPWRLQPCM